MAEEQEFAADAVERLDAAPCGLMQTAVDGTFLRTNSTFCAWVGYTPEELIVRRRFQDLLAMGGRIFYQTHWHPLLQLQGPIQAEAKDRALFAEQMIGIVSHDLRNPLSAIAMGVAILGRSELSGNQQRAANRISRATERATRLISDLLDFTQARLGTGLPVSRAGIDLHEAVADAVDELAQLQNPQPSAARPSA